MNEFQNCEQSLTMSDIQAAEAELGHTLPPSFREHYLRFNGGIPSSPYFPATDEWEPIEVAVFFPIKYNASESNLKRTLVEGKYRFMRDKGVIPEGLLPFAGDHGGNFFCLDMADGKIYFYATDAFDLDLPASENHEKAKRLLANSFGNFLAALTDEANAY